MASPELRTELEKYLESLNIETVCVDHPPVGYSGDACPHIYFKFISVTWYSCLSVLSGIHCYCRLYFSHWYCVGDSREKAVQLLLIVDCIMI